MATYNNIHRQQLFHWIGSHIDDNSTDGKLDDAERGQYVACLRGALKKGLWVKTPRDPDFLGDGSLIKVNRPITCFTEWTLGQSLPHTSRYGRLGLGFSKRFVLSRGGQPLIYVRDAKEDDPYTCALKALAKFFRGGTLDEKLDRLELEKLRQCFDYLAHFNKRIKHQRRPLLVLKKKKGVIVRRKKVTVPDLFTRRFGTTLHYLEEREWRVVFDGSIKNFFVKGPGSPGPEYYMPVVPGRELFTVVLPDNHTVSLAMNDPKIRNSLFPKNAPHVTLLSLQDIGTF